MSIIVRKWMYIYVCVNYICFVLVIYIRNMTCILIHLFNVYNV